MGPRARYVTISASLRRGGLRPFAPPLRLTETVTWRTARPQKLRLQPQNAGLLPADFGGVFWQTSVPEVRRGRLSSSFKASSSSSILLFPPLIGFVRPEIRRAYQRGCGGLLKGGQLRTVLERVYIYIYICTPAAVFVVTGLSPAVGHTRLARSSRSPGLLARRRLHHT